MKKFFISGIGTDVGKTWVTSLLVESIQADYWKPIQSGDLDFTDAMKVKSRISNSKSTFFPERFTLQTPASPHHAARLDQVEIQLTDFTIPETNNHLLIEGAGGLLVPLNDHDTILDLICYLDLPIILVCSIYLGSINHSALSLELLKQKNRNPFLVVFNGHPFPSSTDWLIQKYNIQNYLHLPFVEGPTDKAQILQLSEIYQEEIKKKLEI
jgi:dethiobiotin synthetase